MAATAKQNFQERKVEVNRLELVKTLKENLRIHGNEYQEALAGYKQAFLEKAEEAFKNARIRLDKKFKQVKQESEGWTTEDITKRHASIQIVDPVYLTLPVPRSYEKEYLAAIDMASWDVRDTLELTMAEFNCFVRDEWDWKDEFVTTSSMYKARP